MRLPVVELLSDTSTHGQSDDVSLLHTEEIECPLNVERKIREGQRSLVIVA
jgi:hypothetical protein